MAQQASRLQSPHAIMTLRIVMQTTKGEAVLALHGWLSGPEVAEFERVVGAAPLPLRIDLTNLAGVDGSGITALAAQRVRGARLANASPYVSILLKGHDEEPRTGRPGDRRGRRGNPAGD
jgi:hypothetical protein